MCLKKFLLLILLSGLVVRSSAGAEAVDLKRNGAFGFPQAQARVLCEQADLRVSVWSNAEYLYVQAIVWADGDETLGELNGRKVGDFSQLLLDIDADQQRTPTIDRTYSVGSYANLFGLRYQVVLSERGSTAIQADSKGRGSIKYLDGNDGKRCRVDSFLIPLAEIGKRVGETIRLAHFARSPRPELTLNSIGFESAAAYFSSSLPINKYHEWTLAEGAAFDPKLVPEGREEVALQPSETAPVVPELVIGSRAPELDIEHWVQNGKGKFEPVTKFAPGKVFIVEFWATWCGPCIAAMPHIVELQNKYADQGLQVVSISDETLDIVEKFLEKKAPAEKDKEAITYGELTSQYCLTTDPDRSNHTNYMKAAKQNGIPCAFVVGKDGFIEWIGHPMSIDKALASVVSGDWDRAAFAVEYKQEQELREKTGAIMSLAQKSRFEEALAIVTEIRENTSSALVKQRTDSLTRAVRGIEVEQHILKNSDEASAKLEALLKGRPFSEVNTFVWTKIVQVKERGRKISDEVLATATRLIEKAVDDAPTVDDRGQGVKAQILDTLAHLLNLQGQLDKAIEVQQRALEHVDAAGKEKLEDYLKTLQDLKNPSADSATGVSPQQQNFDYPSAVVLKASYFPRWLGIAAVQKELELTPAQITEIATLVSVPPSKKIADVITTQQLHRLDQIYWHFAGGLATRDPEVANSLGLSEEQRTRIEALGKEVAKKMRSLNPRLSPTDHRKSLDEINHTRDAKIAEILTKEQNDALVKLRGKPFDADFLAAPSGFNRAATAPSGFSLPLPSTMIQLLVMPTVQADLKLSDEIKEKVTKYTTDTRKMLDAIREEFPSSRVGEGSIRITPESAPKMQEMQTKRAALEQSTWLDVRPLLSESQSERLVGLAIQRYEVRSLCLQPVEELTELDAEQKKIVAQARVKFDEARQITPASYPSQGQTPGQLPEFIRKRSELIDEGNRLLDSIMTDQLRSRMEKLKGAKFDFPQPTRPAAPSGFNRTSSVGPSPGENSNVPSIHELRRFDGHTDKATFVSVSPDGRTLLSSSDDKTVRLWDVETGKELKALQGHQSMALCAVFAPDGKHFLTSSGWPPRSGDDSIRLWDLQSGRELWKADKHSDSIWKISTSADGKRALTASRDKTIGLWNVQTGELIKQFTGHTNWVRQAVFVPNQELAVSASWDQTIRIWDLATGDEVRRIDGHKAQVQDIAVSPDGKLIASCSNPPNASVRVWDLQTGEEVRRMAGPTSRPWTIAFSPNGRTILSGGDDKIIRLWDVQTGELLAKLEGHTDIVRRATYSPDGRFVASASHDTTIRLWQLPQLNSVTADP